MSRLLPVVLGTLLVGGCFYPSDRGRALEARLDRLTADNEKMAADLKASQEQMSATLPKVDGKIAEVSRAMESLDKAARRSGADIGVQLQKTVEDVAQLRGQVETYLHRIAELESGLKALTEQTDLKLTELKAGDAVARKKAEESQCGSDKADCLKLAGEKAKAGEVAVARSLYAQILKRWSKDKDDLQAEAHYGLGETFFGENKCREALYEYGKVIENFSKARAAPNAYLRSSECFHKLNMAEESRIALEEVVKGFPKSAAAKTARTRLAELSRKPARKKGRK